MLKKTEWEPFPFILNSPYVTHKSIEAILNTLQYFDLDTFLIKHSSYSNSKLRVNDINHADWSLKQNVITKLPKSLHLWLS